MLTKFFAITCILYKYPPNNIKFDHTRESQRIAVIACRNSTKNADWSSKESMENLSQADFYISLLTFTTELTFLILLSKCALLGNINRNWT